MLLLRKFVSSADLSTSSFIGSLRPANLDRPSWINFHLASRVAPGTRLVVAIAPAFTMGLVRPSDVRSMPATELNAKPVAFAPSFLRASSAPSSWQINANRNGFDTLMIENSWSVSPAAWMMPFVSTTQIPNKSARILALGRGFEFGVCFGHQRFNEVGSRQMPGRNIGTIRSLRGNLLVH